MDTEQILDQLGAFVRGLEGLDRLAFWSAAATMLFCCFPWIESPVDGETLGVTGLGLGVFAAALASILALAHRRGAGSNPAVPSAGQLAAAMFSLLWTLVCVKLAFHPVVVTSSSGGSEVASSEAGVGAYLSILSTGLSAAAAVFGLKGDS